MQLGQNRISTNTERLKMISTFEKYSAMSNSEVSTLITSLGFDLARWPQLTAPKALMAFHDMLSARDGNLLGLGDAPAEVQEMLRDLFVQHPEQVAKLAGKLPILKTSFGFLIGESIEVSNMNSSVKGIKLKLFANATMGNSNLAAIAARSIAYFGYAAKAYSEIIVAESTDIFGLLEIGIVHLSEKSRTKAERQLQNYVGELFNNDNINKILDACFQIESPIPTMAVANRDIRVRTTLH